MEYKEEKMVCQNCKGEFTIEPEDFSFYEKIKVPPPTFCFECRTIRRLCWRNEMSFFKRKCDAPEHDEILISFIHPDEKVVVCDSKYWWGDKWDPIDYGLNYDFKKPFFLQWKELRDKIPLQNLSNIHATNSDYCNVADSSKNSYMCSGSWHIENTFYSNRIAETKDSSDLYVVGESELCYDDVLCLNCYHLLYSLDCKNCVDSYFLYDCHGCTNCFVCTNLRNKSYCMYNKQLKKEEYFEKLDKINLKNNEVFLKLKEEFKDLYLNAIHKHSTKIKVVNSTGDNLEGAKNCKICFDATGQIEDAKYSHWMKKNIKDVYDCGPGVGNLELAYECFDTGIGNFRNLFTSVVYSCNDVEYSFNCHGCSNLFGCIGLRNKKYCILNKQYRKEEYEELLIRIKKQMMDLPYIDKRGIIYKYGEFFPDELSTFCYNETQAEDYYPKTKEEAINKGYRWRDREVNDYKTTIKARELEDDPDKVDSSIFGQIIECKNAKFNNSNCRRAYKITEGELNLYKKIGVPLPKTCFFCRHYERLKLRNPLKLWHRTCMKEGCINEFETSYAPERPEIIYCDDCYKKEIY